MQCLYLSAVSTLGMLFKRATSHVINGIGCALQTYRYLRYPSETITRSGYQIQRKNLAVAAVRQGVIYTLNARLVLRILSQSFALLDSLGCPLQLLSHAAMPLIFFVQ